MQVDLPCFRVVVVLSSLIPSSLSFSRGASHASCQEMIPGHIRAQPLDPQHSHVTLRTSASSYLPGQLITVTVRSSRDFMGFLLQARHVKEAEGGVGSSRLGPVLVGGSWTSTPPGTHTLRCLSEGDTLTHSDKQLKRNLSFVWRAPDAPMGDVRFYMTVVQSYFVYWAGIESAVVRDGSRSSWRGSDIKGVNTWTSIFAPPEDKITASPALRVHRASNKQTSRTASHVTSTEPPIVTGSETQSHKSPERVIDGTRPVLEMKSGLTLASYGVEQLKNQAVSERNSPFTTESLHNSAKGSETDNYETSESLSVETAEARTDTGNSVAHTEETHSFHFSSGNLPLTASFPSPQATRMGATTTFWPKLPVQNSTSPPSLVSLPSLKTGEMKRKVAKTNLWDPQLSTVPDTDNLTVNPKTSTTALHSTNDSFNHTNPQRSTSQDPIGPIRDQTSSAKFKTKSSSSGSWQTSITESQTSLFQSSHKPLPQVQTSPSKPLIRFQTVKSQTFSFSKPSPSTTPFPKSHTFSSNFILTSKSPTMQSFTKSHTTLPLTQSQPLFLQHFLQKTLNVSFHYQPVNFSKHQPETSTSGPKATQRQTSPYHTHLQTTTPQSNHPRPQSSNSFLRASPQSIPTQTEDYASSLHTDQSHPDTPPKALSTSPQSWSKPHFPTDSPRGRTFKWKQTRTSVTPRSISHLPLISRFNPSFLASEGKEVKDLQSQAKIKTTSPTYVSLLSATPPPPLSMSTRLSTLHSSSFSSTHTFPTSSPGHQSSTSRLHLSGGLTLVSKQVSSTLPSVLSSSSFSSMRNQLKTLPTLSGLPAPSPISVPPHFTSVQPSSSSPIPFVTSLTLPSLNSSHNQTSASSVPASTSSSSSFTSFQPSLTFSSSSSTISPALSSFISTSPSSISSVSSPSSPARSSSPISTSTSTPSPFSVDLSSSKSPATLSLSSHTPSPHPEPSPAPRRSLHQSLTSTSSPLPSQQLTLGQRLLIRSHIASSGPEPNLNQPTPKTVVHPNPQVHPKLNPSFKQNNGYEFKPNPSNADTELKRPSSPSGTPDNGGKYPDITPRHSAWELGMLLGCSAGLGMVLVVGVRYMYRQACGKRTEVTLNDREREYERGERGMIHVQECGDLVRVRKIRENSFVFLTEYDILATPGD